MIEWNIALGALTLTLSLAVGALLSRWYFTPTGARRAVETVVPLRTLMRPQDGVTDWGHCPAEDRVTLHEYHRDNGRTCWTCRTYTPGGAR
ncbi:hypothetical protein [Streptomyces sp. NPDC058299]|uniref:hypothetical protein n=1 Tax=unclassified Streptomyces TaxID=2593676 RepID=UPI0036E634BD